MNISSPNENIMEIREFSIFPYLIGALFVFIGFTTVFVPPGADFLGGTWLPEEQASWFGIMFIFFGFIPIVLYKSLATKFDKTSRVISIKRTGLLGRKIEQHSLDKIKEVYLTIEYQKGRKYSLYLKLNDNSSILLGTS